MNTIRFENSQKYTPFVYIEEGQDNSS